MDESLRELVSRYIDGDLDDAESSRLDARAVADPELAAEIAAARRLREAVAALAAGMEPPATLDRVMEPLRQSSPAPARAVRLAYRWLGAAAVVVLGVTVAVEVAQRKPAPSLTRPEPAQQRPAREKEEIFKLAPLPTARPDDNRPLGAADHLLEEEPPQPTAPEPAPLEVIGPLPTGSPMTTGDVSIAAPDRRAASRGGRAGEAVSDGLRPPARQPGAGSSEETVAIPRPEPLKSAPSLAHGDRGISARSTGKDGASLEAIAQEPSPRAAEVIVRIAGTDHRVGPRVNCAPGVRRVRLEIRANTVVKAEFASDETDNEVGDGCRLDGLVGSILDGVGDGSHLAVIVVAKPSP